MPNYTLFFTAAFFVLGSIIGSFISVVIYRIHTQQKGIITGRSFCPNCHIKLKSYDMVPLLSYIFLKGRCRACNEKISIHYFLLELVTAITFALVFLKFNFLIDSNPLELIFALTISSIGLSLAFYDAKYLQVPLALSLVFAILGGLGSIFIFGLSWKLILLGGLIGKGFFWIQHVVSKGQWVGLGDSDLGLGIGLILGWPMLLISLFISYVSASIIGIFLLVTKRATRKTKIPFGPFLIAGFLLVLLYGNEILDFYQKLFLS